MSFSAVNDNKKKGKIMAVALETIAPPAPATWKPRSPGAEYWRPAPPPGLSAPKRAAFRVRVSKIGKTV